MNIKVHKNIRKTPLIIGLSSQLFIMFIVATISIMLSFLGGFSMFKLFASIISISLIYFVLQILTNKPYLLDEFLQTKLPIYIENIKNNESR